VRTLAKFTLDVAAANAAIRSGDLERTLKASLETLKPEAAYFAVENGKRAVYIVFDLKSPSDLPSIAEPWFMTAQATVELTPAMNLDDLKSGLEKFAAASGLPGPA
jgi:hypothetical protein